MVEFCFNTGSVVCKVQIERWNFVVCSKFNYTASY